MYYIKINYTSNILVKILKHKNSRLQTTNSMISKGSYFKNAIIIL